MKTSRDERNKKVFVLKRITATVRVTMKVHKKNYFLTV